MNGKTPLNPGTILKHFKGGLYKVIFKGYDAADGNEVVIYASFKDMEIWVRKEPEFHEQVTWPDGVMRNRFIVGEHPLVTEAMQRG